MRNVRPEVLAELAERLRIVGIGSEACQTGAVGINDPQTILAGIYATGRRDILDQQQKLCWCDISYRGHSDIGIAGNGGGRATVDIESTDSTGAAMEHRIASALAGENGCAIEAGIKTPARGRVGDLL